MSEIRKHIEENLSNAEKAYDDAFYRYNEANEKLKKITPFMVYIHEFHLIL